MNPAEYRRRVAEARDLRSWQERALSAEAKVRALQETLDVMIAAHRDHALRPDPCACHRRGRACPAHDLPHRP